MTNYKKIFLEFWELETIDFINCINPNCLKTSVDLHHIDNKGIGGSKKKDYIENLAPCCRLCHDKAHDYKEFNQFIKKRLLFCIELKKQGIFLGF